MNNNKRKHGKSSHKARKIIMIVVISLLILGGAVLAAAYAYGERYYSKHFLSGTIVNDIDVSRMTVDELNQKIKLYTLTILERTQDGETKKEIISGDEVGLELASTDFLEDILANQQKGNWLTKQGQTYTIEDFVGYDESVWKQCMGYLKCFSSDFMISPTDATIGDYDSDRNTFSIIPETYGNKFDQEQVKTLLSNAVLQLTPTIDLEDCDVYEQPNVYSDDTNLNTLITNLNQFVNVSITYTFGDNLEVVDGNLVKDWIIVNDDNTITLDKDDVAAYVETLRKKYCTIFTSRTFMTSYGKEIKLTEGDYGWWMNTAQEVKELAAMIEEGTSGERTPVYYQTAEQFGSQDYGNTYVEVNLTAQHLFYYEDGELILESDFVSGNSSKGNSTPEGIYGITYKQRNATLVGEDYETPVSYWMPFNKHIGLHDATWRYKFGSKIYQTSGSHGCVNLPYDVAKELYRVVAQGTPVICYNLRGTESTSITEQTPEQIAGSVIDRISEIGAVTKDSEKVITRARVVYEELNSAEKKLVTNYQVLVAAEEAYKELTK